MLILTAFMPRTSLVEIAHQIIRPFLHEGAIVIDATLGNGHDTLFLAQNIGETGQVYGFDIQPTALQMSRQRLLQAGMQDRAILQLVSHADMLEHIPLSEQGRVRVIMFNLGYLPGSDKSIKTQADSTLRALTASCEILAEHGVLTVLAYPGHDGGELETQCLLNWMQALNPQHFGISIVGGQGEKSRSPRLFVIRKIA